MDEEINNNYNNKPNYNYEKKNNSVKVLLPILIILAIAILSLLSYKIFVVDMKNDNKQNNSKDNNSENENYNGENNTYVNELKNLNYKILTDENYNVYYLEKNNDSYKVKYELGRADYIGIHDNKLYFKDYEGIKYIEMTNNTNEIKDWLKSETPKCTGVCVGDSINNAVLLNDTIYFDIGYEPADEKNGILTLKFSDTHFNDFKQLIEEVSLGKWNFDDKYEKIYYIGSLYEPSRNDMYVYDLSTKKSEIILKDLVNLDYEYKNGKILYTNKENNKNSNLYDISKLSLYDVNSKKNIVLTSKLHALGLNAQFVDNYVYYLEDNGIIYQYDILKNQTNEYYNINHINHYDSFKFITPNIMKIELWNQATGSDIKYYFKNNKIDFDGKISVTMSDGTIKNFYNSYFSE